MDSTTRDQIFATKSRLHQLTQVNRTGRGREGQEGQDEDRNRAESDKRQSLTRERDLANAEAKAHEEKRYLKQHNKTVARVLGQAAKATAGTGASSDEEEGEDEDDDTEEESDVSERQDLQQNQDLRPTSTNEISKQGDRKGKGKDRESTLTNSRGKSYEIFARTGLSLSFLKSIGSS